MVGVGFDMTTKFAHSERQFNRFVRCQRDDLSVVISHCAGMATDNPFPANLRAARKALGLSLDKLAGAADTSKSYLSELERAVRPTPPGAFLDRLAKALETTPSKLTGEPSASTEPAAELVQSTPGDPIDLASYRDLIAPPGALSRPGTAGRSRAVARKIPVVGEVAAGVWRETVQRDFFGDGEHLDMDVQGYERAELRAWRVIGPSMNLVYPEGRFVVTAHPAEAGVRNGDYVIVERQKAGLVEITLKEIVRETDGRIALWPRSSDLEFQQPIYLTVNGDDDQTGPVIVGVVVADYSRRTRPPANY